MTRLEEGLGVGAEAPYRFWFRMSLKCLHSSSLALRVFGLDRLVELANTKAVRSGVGLPLLRLPLRCSLVAVANHPNAPTYTQGAKGCFMTPALMATWVAEAGVLAEVFGSRIHVQMVAHCAPLVRFLVLQGRLTHDDVAVVRAAKSPPSPSCSCSPCEHTD